MSTPPDWVVQVPSTQAISQEPASTAANIEGPDPQLLIAACNALMAQIPIFSALQNLGQGTFGGVIGNILNGAQKLATDLTTVFTTLINSLEGVDWTTPEGFLTAFNALVQFAKDLRDWVVEVLQTLLSIIAPTVWSNLETALATQQLKDAVNNLKAAWGAINWADWTETPANLNAAWMAFYDFLHAIVDWAITVLNNTTGVDARNAFAAFDLPQLRAAWDGLVATWQSINWTSPDALGTAAGALITFAGGVKDWAITVFNNVGQLDFTNTFAGLELPTLRAAFTTFFDTLKAIDWAAPGGGVAFLGATITVLQSLGNWLLAVFTNMLGITTDPIHAAFASISAFIYTLIAQVLGQSAADSWQSALNDITGATNATASQAINAVYHQFSDVLAMLGNPADIGTTLFDVETAIENFITEVLDPTGLLSSAGADISGIINAFVNTFLGLGGSGFTVDDLIRAIQSIPSNLMVGTFDPGQISHLNIGSLSAFIPELLVNGNFDTASSIIGQGIWNWDGTQGPPGLSTSVYTDAAGALAELYSDVINVYQGMVLTISGMTKWQAVTGSTIALTVAKFDATKTLVGYDTIAAAASPSGTQTTWQTLSGNYSVPAGVNYLFVRPIVGADTTAGRVWFGQLSAKQTATSLLASLIPLLDASKIGTGQFAQTMITNLTSDLSARALVTDLDNTWNTIISALGGTGAGLAGIDAALRAIPGANVSGFVNTVSASMQSLIDAILGAFNPSYVDGTGTLASVEGALQAIPQINVTNLTSDLSARALQTDFNNLMLNLGLGTNTLSAITARFTNINSSGILAAVGLAGIDASKVISGQFTQSMVANLTTDLSGKALASDLQTVIDGAYQAVFGGSTTGNPASVFNAIMSNIPNQNVIGILGPNQIGQALQAAVDSIFQGFSLSALSNIGLGQLSNIGTQIANGLQNALNLATNNNASLAARASSKPSYAAIDSTADPVFNLSNITGATAATLALTSAASVIGFIDTPDAGIKQSIAWLGYGTANITAMYLNLYKLNTSTGAMTLMYSSPNIIGSVGSGSTPSWNYYNLPTSAYVTTAQADCYAVEMWVTGTGTYSIVGLTNSWMPAHPTAYPKQLGATQSPAPTIQTPTWHATGTAQGGGWTPPPKSVTIPITIPSTDNCLVVPVNHVTMQTASALSVTATLASTGKSIPLVASQVSSGCGAVLFFGLMNPPTGAQSIIVKSTASSNNAALSADAMSYAGIAGFGSSATTNGVATSASHTVTIGATGQRIVQFFAVVYQNTNNWTAYNQTQRFITPTNSYGGIVCGDAAGASSVAFTATLGNSVNWVSLALVLNAAAGANISSPTWSTNVPWFALCGAAGTTQYPPATTVYNTAGTATYTVPAWVKSGNHFDIAVLGGGGGGGSWIAGVNGNGGHAGAWGTPLTLTYGVDIPLSTTSFSVTVGAGGTGTSGNGNAGGASSVTITGYGTVTGAGGSGGAGGGGSTTGASPGNEVINGTTYYGGAAETVAGYNGNPPGGGSGGGVFGGGGGPNGAAGEVWITAY